MIISRVFFYSYLGALCGCSHWSSDSSAASVALNDPIPAEKPSEPEVEVPRLEIVEAEQATLSDQDLVMGLELTAKRARGVL